MTCTTRKLAAASKENNTTNAQGDDGAEAQVQDEKAIASLAECESVLLADVSRAVQNPHFGSIHGEGGGVENDGGNCHLMIGPLSDAQIRAYQYWDLMAIAQQVPVEVEINHRSYQSFSVDPSDETVREMHACRRAGDTFRAVGYYGYNDNYLAVFVDVNGRPAAASGGGPARDPFHFFGIDFWDDQYDEFTAADDAFLEQMIATQPAPVVVVFEGSLIEVLLRVKELESESRHIS